MSTLPRSRSSIAIVSGAVVIGAGTFALRPPAGSTMFIGFLVLIAVSDLLEVSLPNDARFSLGLAPALGFALLGHHSATESVTAFVAGVAAASALRFISQRPLRLVDSSIHVIALAGAASAYNVVEHIGSLPQFRTHSSASSLSVFGIAAVFVVVLVVEVMLNAVRTIESERIPLLPVFRGLLRSSAALHLSLLSVSALLALAFPSLQYWSFPLILAPLAATQYAFRQFESIRRTYLQTIRALSRVPEMAGYSQDGHSQRVAALSVAIAKDLGYSEQPLREIEYAALLHDIGHVSVAEPSDIEHASKRELAVVGAAIVRQTGHFPAVADMIERQHDSYSATESRSHIIKVASAYDDLTRGHNVGLSPDDAMRKLRWTDSAPTIVDALQRVLTKRGALS